jgi:hypothetical protein
MGFVAAYEGRRLAAPVRLDGRGGVNGAAHLSGLAKLLLEFPGPRAHCRPYRPAGQSHAERWQRQPTRCHSIPRVSETRLVDRID